MPVAIPDTDSNAMPVMATGKIWNTYWPKRNTTRLTEYAASEAVNILSHMMAPPRDAEFSVNPARAGVNMETAEQLLGYDLLPSRQRR